MKKYGILLILFLCGIVFGRASELIDLINTFRADTYALKRTYNMDESEEYYSRFTTFQKDWGQKVNQVDFKALSSSGKIDKVLLKNLFTKESYLLSPETLES